MNLMKISLGLNIVATIFAFVVMALTFTAWCLFTWFDSAEDKKYQYSHFVMTFSILLICLIQATLGILASIFASNAIKNYNQAIIQEFEMNPNTTKHQEVAPEQQQELTSLHHEDD